MPKTYTNNETIVIPFPEEKFYYQLKRVGVSNEDKLTFFKLAQLMVNSIGDFREGKMSLDELSEILNTLRWNENGFFHKQDEELQDRFFEIGNVLESGAELSYYLRHAVDEGKPNETFIEYLYEVMRFYDRRADILANVAHMEKGEN